MERLWESCFCGGWVIGFSSAARQLVPLLRHRLPQVDHTAFLLFLRLRICHHQHLAVIDFMLEEQQAAMSADHHGLASFLELLAVVSAPLSLHADFVEGSRASSWCC